MPKVTVLVTGDVVIVRGRDHSGAVVAEAVVPLADMSEAHVAAMRARLTL